MRTYAFILAALLVSASVTLAADLPLHPYSYHEGFEGAMPAVSLWAKNGSSTVNFLGITDEAAYEGTHSLKLDVTLGDGSYYYFGAPVHVPEAGRLRISARMLVAAGTTGRVGFGTNDVYPPTSLSGCSPITAFDGPTGDWKLVEGDLVEIGRSGASRVAPTNTINLRGEDVAPSLDLWSLFVYGTAPQRVVVYLDDITIAGEVPSQADYDAAIRRHAEEQKAAFAATISTWQAELTQARKSLPLLAHAPAAGQWVAMVQAADARAQELINTCAGAGTASQADVEALKAQIAIVRNGPQTAATIAEARAAGRPLVYANGRAITNTRSAPDVMPLGAPIGGELTLSGCRGEYESGSAGAFAFDEIKSLRVRASGLQGTGMEIPASAVDIRVVKYWYQGASGGIAYSPQKALVPELLLKDDALVRVDTTTRDNYLRSTGEDGSQTYLLCSGPTSENLANVRPVDADELQPVDIAPNTSQEFWVTVRIPQDARPGTYRGKLMFRAGSAVTSLPLRLIVHPFELLPSRLTYSIYYRANLSPDGKPTIGSELKSEQQYRAEMADMQAHGVLYPANYAGMDERLTRVMQLRREVGMPGGRFYNLGWGPGNAGDPASLAQVRADVGVWLEFCKPFGYDHVYFYGFDEATGDALKSQRQAWKVTQEAGGRTFVACYSGTFEVLGGLLNCAVYAGPPDPAEARKYHSVGSEIFCYANPQVGVEAPETYRRNFGLLLWKNGYDGAMDYAYQHAFGHIWNDFDDHTYRDHTFTYPTVNGVVGTLEWEGFREGVDDVRYATTLEQAIKQAPASRAKLSQQARAWLDALNPAGADLDATRTQMVVWIGKLKG